MEPAGTAIGASNGTWDERGRGAKTDGGADAGERKNGVGNGKDRLFGCARRDSPAGCGIGGQATPAPSSEVSPARIFWLSSAEKQKRTDDMGLRKTISFL